MLALNSSFTSYLVPYPTVLPDIEVTASRIMQFDPKGKCLTPDIAFAIIAVLKSPSTELATKVNIFRNALACGYVRDLLDRIEDRVADFEPELALCEALQDEGILLEKQEGALSLTRSHVQQDTDPAAQLASDVLGQLGLPTDIVRLIATKVRITPKEKTGAVEQYLGRNISGWTQKQLNDALLQEFTGKRSLPKGKERLELSDFEFHVPVTQHRVVPDSVKLINCRLTSGALHFRMGTVTAIHEDATPYAAGPEAIAFAGVPGSLAKSYGEGTAIAIAETSRASASDEGSRSFAKAPRSTAIAVNCAAAIASATSSSAEAYRGGWAIAGAHSSAFASTEVCGYGFSVKLTESQYSVFLDKSPRQRRVVTSLIYEGTCIPSSALNLPEGVLTALGICIERNISLGSIAVEEKLKTLLQNEKFIEELGSLACQQQLKAETISLHDLMRRFSPDPSGFSSSGSALSTSSSSSSSTSSGMGTWL